MFLRYPVPKQPAWLAVYRIDGIMWNKMHLDNSCSIYAGADRTVSFK